MKDLSIFIPLHTFNTEIGDSLNNAISSVFEQDKNIQVFVSIPDEHYNDLIKLSFMKNKVNVIKLEKNTPTDFCSQVNYFSKLCTTKWFSILEYDDAYTKIWFKNAELYFNSNNDASILLPLTEIHDYTSGDMVSFANEIVWATSFSDDIGYIDSNCLEAYTDFSMTGGIYNTSDFIEVGGLKPSIKITFWVEFLLRFTNKQKKIFVVPKIGYVHMIGREDSLMDIYTKTISKEEGEWWYNLAKSEYFFTEDRRKEYNPENNKNEIAELK